MTTRTGKALRALFLALILIHEIKSECLVKNCKICSKPNLCTTCSLGYKRESRVTAKGQLYDVCKKISFWKWFLPWLYILLPLCCLCCCLGLLGAYLAKRKRKPKTLKQPHPVDPKKSKLPSKSILRPKKPPQDHSPVTSHIPTPNDSYYSSHPHPSSYDHDDHPEHYQPSTRRPIAPKSYDNSPKSLKPHHDHHKKYPPHTGDKRVRFKDEHPRPIEPHRTTRPEPVRRPLEDSWAPHSQQTYPPSVPSQQNHPEVHIPYRRGQAYTQPPPQPKYVTQTPQKSQPSHQNIPTVITPTTRYLNQPQPPQLHQPTLQTQPRVLMARCRMELSPRPSDYPALTQIHNISPYAPQMMTQHRNHVPPNQNPVGNLNPQVAHPITPQKVISNQNHPSAAPRVYLSPQRAPRIPGGHQFNTATPQQHPFNRNQFPVSPTPKYVISNPNSALNHQYTPQTPKHAHNHALVYPSQQPHFQQSPMYSPQVKQPHFQQPQIHQNPGVKAPQGLLQRAGGSPYTPDPASGVIQIVQEIKAPFGMVGGGKGKQGPSPSTGGTLKYLPRSGKEFPSTDSKIAQNRVLPAGYKVANTTVFNPQNYPNSAQQHQPTTKIMKHTVPRPVFSESKLIKGEPSPSPIKDKVGGTNLSSLVIRKTIVQNNMQAAKNPFKNGEKTRIAKTRRVLGDKGNHKVYQGKVHRGKTNLISRKEPVKDVHKIKELNDRLEQQRRDEESQKYRKVKARKTKSKEDLKSMKRGVKERRASLKGQNNLNQPMIFDGQHQTQQDQHQQPGGASRQGSLKASNSEQEGGLNHQPLPNHRRNQSKAPLRVIETSNHRDLVRSSLYKNSPPNEHMLGSQNQDEFFKSALEDQEEDKPGNGHFRSSLNDSGVSFSAATGHPDENSSAFSNFNRLDNGTEYAETESNVSSAFDNRSGNSLEMRNEAKNRRRQNRKKSSSTAVKLEVGAAEKKNDRNSSSKHKRRRSGQHHQHQQPNKKHRSTKNRQGGDGDEAEEEGIHQADEIRWRNVDWNPTSSRDFKRVGKHRGLKRKPEGKSHYRNKTEASKDLKNHQKGRSGDLSIPKSERGYGRSSKTLGNEAQPHGHQRRRGKARVVEKQPISAHDEESVFAEPGPLKVLRVKTDHPTQSNIMLFPVNLSKKLQDALMKTCEAPGEDVSNKENRRGSNSFGSEDGGKNGQKNGQKSKNRLDRKNFSKRPQNVVSEKSLKKEGSQDLGDLYYIQERVHDGKKIQILRKLNDSKNKSSDPKMKLYRAFRDKDKKVKSSRKALMGFINRSIKNSGVYDSDFSKPLDGSYITEKDSLDLYQPPVLTSLDNKQLFDPEEQIWNSPKFQKEFEKNIGSYNPAPKSDQKSGSDGSPLAKNPYMEAGLLNSPKQVPQLIQPSKKSTVGDSYMLSDEDFKVSSVDQRQFEGELYTSPMEHHQHEGGCEREVGGALPLIVEENGMEDEEMCSVVSPRRTNFKQFYKNSIQTNLVSAGRNGFGRGLR